MLKFVSMVNSLLARVITIQWTFSHVVRSAVADPIIYQRYSAPEVSQLWRQLLEVCSRARLPGSKIGRLILAQLVDFHVHRPKLQSGDLLIYFRRHRMNSCSKRGALLEYEHS